MSQELPPFLQQNNIQPPAENDPGPEPVEQPDQHENLTLDFLKKTIPEPPEKTDSEIKEEEKAKKKAASKSKDSPPKKKRGRPKKKKTEEPTPEVPDATEASNEEPPAEAPKKRGRPKKKSSPKTVAGSDSQHHEPGTRVAVARHYQDGMVIREHQDSGMIKVLPFDRDCPPAYIEVSGNFTKNQGNFESAKFGVSIRIPAYVEELPEAYKAAYGMMVEALTDQRQRLEEMSQ